MTPTVEKNRTRRAILHQPSKAALAVRLPDELLDAVIESWPRWSDRQPLSQHLEAEITWSSMNGPLPPGEPIPSCQCEDCVPELETWEEAKETTVIPFPAEPKWESWNARVDQARAVSLLDITPSLGLGDPKRRGKEFLVRCPLHEDTKPSMTLNAQKGFWYCFPCGEGGDGLKLVQRALRLSFREAVDWLVGASS